MSSMELNQLTYEAMYSYDASRPGDLGFSAGDELEVVGKQEGGWWKAVNKRTGQKGYIPQNFIQKKAEISVVDSSKLERKALGQYVAIYDYFPSDDKTLFFKKNQRMNIFEKTNDSWWWAGLDRDGVTVEGYVPADYVTKAEGLRSEPWYYGVCSREEAQESLLLPYNFTGSFLVRDSETSEGYSLSVLLNGEVKHYRIREDQKQQFFVSKNQFFKSVQELITYYQNNTGICTHLLEPCRTEAVQARTLISELSVTPVVKSETQSRRPDWEIDRNTIVLGKKLGSGQFGEVLLGMWNDQLEVAVKSMKPGSMELQEFLAEADTMQKLKHPRLVKLFGLCTIPNDQPLLIVCELVSNGALLDHLRKRKIVEHNLHSIGELISMGAQVASGMAYLESQNIVHRDLAARNVLIGNGINVKIADFGLARVMKEEIYEKQSEAKVPVKWTAPEALNQNLYTSKSDVWSYGILLYEILTHGDPPYGGMANRVALHWIEDGNRMACPGNCPQMLYQLMTSCWEMNPALRPSFKDLKAKMETLKTFFPYDLFPQ